MRLKETWLKWGALAVLAAAMLPFVYVCRYVHPVNDDYLYALDHIGTGVWQSVADSYMSWSGRYFATFLSALNPLLLDGGSWFPACSAVVVLLFVALVLVAVWLLFRRRLDFVSIFAVASMLIAVYLTLMPKISEFFYWFSSATAYTVPSLLGLLVLALLPYRHWGVTLLNSVLVFCVVGGNEVLTVLMTMILLGVAVRCRERRLWVIFGAAVAGALLVVLSPGNAVRMSGQLSSSPYLWAAVVSSGQTLAWFFLWLPGLLLVTPLYIALVGVRTAGAEVFNIKFLRYAGFVLVTVFLAHIPPTLGLSSVLIGRTANTLLIFFVVMYFFGVNVLVHGRRSAVESYFNGKFTRVFLVLCTVVFLFGFLFGVEGNVVTAYMDAASGKAANYDRALSGRNDLMLAHDGGEGLVFAPLDVVPKTLFVKDLECDSAAVFCTAYRRYYGLDFSVCVDAGNPRYTTNYETLFSIGKSVRQ